MQVVSGADLVEVSFLKQLPPCLWADWQNADAITQKIQDEAKVLRISVNEHTPLQTVANVSAACIPSAASIALP